MQNWKSVAAILATSGFLAACSSGGDGGSAVSPGRSVTVKGQFNPGQLPQSGALTKAFAVPGFDAQILAVSNEVRCMTLSEPASTSSSVVGAAGDFSMNLSVPEGQAVGCFLVTKNNAAIVSWVAMLFQSKPAASGSGQLGQDGIPLSSDTTELNFGGLEIVSNPNGSISVSAPDATTNGTVALPDFADMTGEWNIASIATGEGNVHPCDMDETDPVRISECKTEWQIRPIFIHTFSSTKANEEDRGAISLWHHKPAFDACGTEGITFNAGWTTTDTKVTPDLPDDHSSEIDWTNLSPAVMAKAKYRISYGDHGQDPEMDNNCPYTRVRNGMGQLVDSIDNASGKTPYQQCLVARSCADFNYKNDQYGARAKAACLVESLSSNDDVNGYNWPTTGTPRCGKRLSISYNDQNALLANITSATGCTDAGCGVITNGSFTNTPKYRRFVGELFATGNLGTGMSSELDKQRDSYSDGNGQSNYFCNMYRELSFQITQNSAASAVFAVKINVYPQSGTIQAAGSGERDPVADDIGKPWFDNVRCMEKEWVVRSLSAPMKIKLTLQKK